MNTNTIDTTTIVLLYYYNTVVVLLLGLQYSMQRGDYEYDTSLFSQMLFEGGIFVAKYTYFEVPLLYFAAVLPNVSYSHRYG